jgi:cyclase
MDAIKWALVSAAKGAGEILVTSVDKDGTRKGFDTALVAEIAPNVAVPVTASGGMGNLEHLKAVLRDGKADAVAVGSALHYGKTNFAEMRAAAQSIRNLT